MVLFCCHENNFIWNKPSTVFITFVFFLLHNFSLLFLHVILCFLRVFHRIFHFFVRGVRKKGECSSFPASPIKEPPFPPFKFGSSPSFVITLFFYYFNLAGAYEELHEIRIEIKKKPPQYSRDCMTSHLVSNWLLHPHHIIPTAKNFIFSP